MAVTVTEVAADLGDEQVALDGVVAELSDDAWSTPTASPRWSVGDQIGHLGYFDRTATRAITDPDGFADDIDALIAAGREATDLTLAEPRALAPAALLAWWREGRSALLSAARGLTDDSRVVWYGPSMGAASFLTARLMETWAHGQDIVEAVGARRPATERLRHVAQIGFITRKWSFVNRGLDPPETEVRVELVGPGGGTWAFGPQDAESRITGAGEDFCLVVTQRRHVVDTGLLVAGPPAEEWMAIAQAFAGPATLGPQPGALT